MSPKLTVILPVHNGMPYLPEAVESILGQSYAEFTFVIVNDGSRDGSGEYLRSLNDPRIVLIDQVNQGQGAAINAGLRACQTEYVAYMDADDVSMRDRLRLQLEYMEAHPDVVMLGTQVEFLVGNARQTALNAPLAHEGIRGRLLKGHAGVCHPSLMLRTQTAMAVGGYPTWSLGLDIEFCLLMCEQGKVANLERVLYQYRFHPNQTSSAHYKGLIGANRWAAYRAICRGRGVPEPSLEEFRKQSSWLERWRWSSEAWELNQYRTGRILMASGRPLSGFLRLALVGACRPFKTVRRGAQTLAALLGAHGG